jgi:PAS domain S-box-containing protein
VAQRGFQKEFLDYFRYVDADDGSICGQALKRQSRVIIEDVRLDPGFAPHLAIAVSSGFRAVQSTPLFDRASGNPVGMLSSHFRKPHRPSERELRLTDLYAQQAADMIGFRLAQQKLRESEAQLLAILKQVPGAVGMFDDEGRLRLRGGPLAHLWSDVIPSRDSASIRRWRSFDAKGGLLPTSQYPGARALRGETVSPGLDFIHTADDGRETWIRVSAAPFRNEEGKIAGAVAILQDIDEEKHVQQRSRESEARLQAAIDLLGLGQYSWNPKTNDLEWDERAKGLWGLPPGAHVDFDVFMTGIHPDDRTRVEEAIAKCVDPNGDGIYDIEYRVIGADQVVRWVATRGQASFENGIAIAFFGVALDVTERNQAELAKVLLIAELQHRTRNILAVVHSISAQTRAASKSLEDYSVEFNARLSALSRVQGLPIPRRGRPDHHR